jgi:hypothetical protein
MTAPATAIPAATRTAVEDGLSGLHVLLGGEVLDHHRGPLVRIVEDLDSRRRHALWRPLHLLGRCLALCHAPRIDIREPDDACVHALLLRRGERDLCLAI